MRRAAIGLLVLVTLVSVPSVAAGAGGREVVFADHVDVVDTLAHCGSFDVVDHAIADFTGILYFDSAGEPRRFRLRIDGTDTLSSSAGGPSYSSPNVLTYTEDMAQNRAWKTGVAFSVTVPKYGRVLTDVGVIMFDENGITVHGRHDAMSGDLSALCAPFEAA